MILPQLAWLLAWQSLPAVPGYNSAVGAGGMAVGAGGTGVIVADAFAPGVGVMSSWVQVLLLH